MCRESQHAYLELEFVKHTNGQVAVEEPGPELSIGSTVTWTYIVTNAGNVPLTDIELNDELEGRIICPTDEIAAGSTITCLATGIVEAGLYYNSATAVGYFSLTSEPVLSQVAISHYFGVSGFNIFLPLIIR